MRLFQTALIVYSLSPHSPHCLLLLLLFRYICLLRLRPFERNLFGTIHRYGHSLVTTKLCILCYQIVIEFHELSVALLLRALSQTLRKLSDQLLLYLQNVLLLVLQLVHSLLQTTSTNCLLLNLRILGLEQLLNLFLELLVLFV